MTTINPFNIARPRIQEVHDFLKQIVGYGRAMFTSATDVAVLAPLIAATDKLDAGIKQTLVNEQGRAAKAADEVADDAYSATRAYLKAMRCHPNAELAAQAETVWLNSFDKYGNLRRMGEREEYGSYGNLLGDLNAIDTEVMTALGLAEWVNSMGTAYSQYIVARDARVVTDAEYQVGLAKEARLEAEAAYRTFVDKINALILINGDEQYAEFVRLVNVCIADTQAMLKNRATRAENEETTEETPETTEN